MIFESAIIYILHISPPIGIEHLFHHIDPSYQSFITLFELLDTNTNTSESVIVQIFKYDII